MAEITTPFTGAMKRRAKAAIEELRPRVTAGKKVIRDPNWKPEKHYSDFTPKELRSLIIRVGQKNGVDMNKLRSEMKSEGWFIPASGTRREDGNLPFKSESATKVRL